MKTSEPCLDLLSSLLAARLAFPPITRNCEAWSPKSKKTYLYADLNAIIDATVPVLGAHGLLMMQSLGDGTGETLCLTSTLFHVASGQWVRSEVSVMRPEGMHDLGATCTYIKRYQMAALLNISTEEDDDAASLHGASKAEKSAAVENPRPSMPVNGNGHTPAPDPDEALAHPTEGHIAALSNLALTACHEDKEVYYQRIRTTMGLKPSASVAPRLLTRTMSMAQYMTIFAYYRRMESQLAKSNKEITDGAAPGPAQVPATESTAETPAAESLSVDPPSVPEPEKPSPVESSSAPAADPEDAADTVEGLVADAISWGLKEDVTRRVIHLYRDLTKCRKILVDAAERNRRQVA